MKPLSIYIHIPFCIRKCYYCDFLSAPAEEKVKREYVKAILAEIERESPYYGDFQVQTVFIGGGTPSCLEAEEIGMILCSLRKLFFFDPSDKPEITIEVNPGTVSAEKLMKYREAGISRLSIGLQSANDAELKMLGRIHTWDDFTQTYEVARKVGFQNINVDVISALPGQSKASWAETLKKVMALEPEHISAYSLIIEEGTLFYDRYGAGGEGEAFLPAEEEEREIYLLTGSLLKRNLYTRYEISNYARPGFECRHNMVYWQRGDYVGFGLGAASMVSNSRWKNTKDLDHYIGRPDWVKEEEQKLTTAEQMEEFMYLGLRLMQGVSREKFRKTFHQEVETVYGDTLLTLERQKLITNGAYIALTPYGIDISNYVMSQFLMRE